ncbi:hypothetical protein SAMN05216551_10183 [Chitinasiproducens palmae]|uniref:Uncharacterized protein n=1 Tax=Chitinasiproducens palmae TaxID=1770053 RepID=A0A1H2PIU0_9BURK|nr:hypothetical protein SAMN05216551_10183 [Chitinasiproducens palmae]
MARSRLLLSAPVLVVLVRAVTPRRHVRRAAMVTRRAKATIEAAVPTHAPATATASFWRRIKKRSPGLPRRFIAAHREGEPLPAE